MRMISNTSNERNPRYMSETDKPERWQIGDRVIWEHADGRGRGRRTVRSAGTVTGIDLPDLPPGVKVEFDIPVYGQPYCYATHAELVPESL